jgi:hypothetical protein
MMQKSHISVDDAAITLTGGFGGVTGDIESQYHGTTIVVPKRK